MSLVATISLHVHVSVSAMIATPCSMGSSTVGCWRRGKEGGREGKRREGGGGRMICMRTEAVRPTCRCQPVTQCTGRALANTRLISCAGVTGSVDATCHAHVYMYVIIITAVIEPTLWSTLYLKARQDGQLSLFLKKNLP